MFLLFNWLLSQSCIVRECGPHCAGWIFSETVAVVIVVNYHLLDPLLLTALAREVMQSPPSVVRPSVSTSSCEID